MTRVLIEQQVIPFYRVPFFSRLAEKVDLTVVTSSGVSVDGVDNVTEDLPFKTIKMGEVLFRKRFFSHDGLLTELEKSPSIYITGKEFLLSYIIQPERLFRLRRSKTHVIWWGCDGYFERNFLLARKQRSWKANLWPPPSWRRLIFNSERLAMKIPEGFIAYSSYTARYWKEVWNIPDSRISIAHNSIEFEPVLKAYNHLDKQQRKWNDHKLIFVGRITSGKKLDLLIQAYKNILPKIPDISLDIIGDGPLKESLEKKAAYEGLVGIKFWGKITRPEELALRLSQAAILIMPGLGGLGINTAMACALPVICTYSDGTELDLVEEGVNGWFFEDNNVQSLTLVIHNALINSSHLHEMGENSLQKLQTIFTIDHMAAAFVNRIQLVSEEP